jgi:hypothetical protein
MHGRALKELVFVADVCSWTRNACGTHKHATDARSRRRPLNMQKLIAQCCGSCVLALIGESSETAVTVGPECWRQLRGTERSDTHRGPRHAVDRCTHGRFRLHISPRARRRSARLACWHEAQRVDPRRRLKRMAAVHEERQPCEWRPRHGALCCGGGVLRGMKRLRHDPWHACGAGAGRGGPPWNWLREACCGEEGHAAAEGARV